MCRNLNSFICLTFVTIGQWNWSITKVFSFTFQAKPLLLHTPHQHINTVQTLLKVAEKASDTILLSDCNVKYACVSALLCWVTMLWPSAAGAGSLRFLTQRSRSSLSCQTATVALKTWLGSITCELPLGVKRRDMLYKLVHNCIKLLWEKGRREEAAASRKTKAAAKEISADVAIEALLSQLERRRQKKKKKH